MTVHDGDLSRAGQEHWLKLTLAQAHTGSSSHRLKLHDFAQTAFSALWPSVSQLQGKAA
jgi:hypothetical protein